MSIRKFASRFAYGFKTIILGREIPYLFIIVINDRCNLNCFYCETKNSGRFNFTYDLAVNELQRAYQRGNRSLVVTGGEPTLWQDSGRDLNDLIQFAKRIGFLDIFIYTNGTSPLTIKGCNYIVTIDGTRELHNKIRNDSYDLIMNNVRKAKSKNVFATITLSKSNADFLESIVDNIAKENVFKGISFNLLTHWMEVVEEHGLLGQDRIDILDRIWALKKKSYPIVFSNAAYKAMKRNNWKRPIPQIELATRDQLFICCRDVGNPEICENCGYSSCVEISQILALKPTAIYEAFRIAG